VILLVEDEPDQRAAITRALAALGHRVVEASTGAAALEMAAVLRPDVVLLDLGLPDVDGLVLCRHLRVQVSCPLVVVTADALEDRIVEVLDLGADDYVLKPFSMNQLLARVRVALRHRLATASLIEDQVLHCGDLTIDTAAHQVIIDGELIDLFPRQFDLLTALVRNEGRVMTYSMLGRVLWGLDSNEDHVAPLRTAISKLRKTLGVGPRRPSIDTEHHVGYRLVVPDSR
jgi:two-component system, OmpR family, KDP operon response regulator KdpE